VHPGEGMTRPFIARWSRSDASSPADRYRSRWRVPRRARRSAARVRKPAPGARRRPPRACRSSCVRRSLHRSPSGRRPEAVLSGRMFLLNVVQSRSYRRSSAGGCFPRCRRCCGSRWSSASAWSSSSSAPARSRSWPSCERPSVCNYRISPVVQQLTTSPCPHRMCHTMPMLRRT